MHITDVRANELLYCGQGMLYTVRGIKLVAIYNGTSHVFALGGNV